MINHAYSGALTSQVISQVAAYTAGSTPAEKALYIVWAGANDFLEGGSDYRVAADNVIEAVKMLVEFKASHVLIMNMINLGAMPRMNNSDDAELYSLLTTRFNDRLKESADDLKENNPDTKIYFFDVYSLFKNIINNPKEYDFSNATSVCLNFTRPNNFDNDGDYVFWDDIHPTTQAHELIADRVLRLVSPSGGGGGGTCFIQTLTRHIR